MTINFKHYCAVFFNPTDGLNEEVSKICEEAPRTMKGKGISIYTFTSIVEAPVLTEYFKSYDRNFLLFDLKEENSGFNFIDKVKASNVDIKTALLSQETIIAGIGNYLADEVCYQSKISPKSICSYIPDGKIAELLVVINDVLAIACDCNEKNVDFPDEWLVQRKERGEDALRRICRFRHRRRPHHSYCRSRPNHVF